MLQFRKYINKYTLRIYTLNDLELFSKIQSHYIKATTVNDKKLAGLKFGGKSTNEVWQILPELQACMDILD